jgi:large subunit ribosomal protein L45
VAVEFKKFGLCLLLQVPYVELPDFEEDERNKGMTPEEMRLKMKEKGLQPGRQWMERPFEISATGDIFEPYLPPEGDGKASIISTEV